MKKLRNTLAAISLLFLASCGGNKDYYMFTSFHEPADEGLRKNVGGEFLLIDSSTDIVKIKDHEVNQEIQSDSPVDFDFRQERPFYVPTD